MRITKKVGLYTALMAATISIFIIGYFIFMLPGLYASYTKEKYVDQLHNLQLHYRKSNTPYGKMLDLPYYTLHLPSDGYLIDIDSSYGSFSLEITDGKAKRLFNKLRDTDFSDASAYKGIPKEIQKELKGVVNLPVQIKESNFNSGEASVEDTNIYYHQENDFISETPVSTPQGDYITYIILTDTEDGVLITLATAMAPRLTELTPIVLESLPMILSMVAILVLLFAAVFAKKLAKPVENLAIYAKDLEKSDATLTSIDGKDEFTDLGNALNSLYTQLKTSLSVVEAQNKELLKQQKGQQLFITAASHQMKTPVASSLLLLDSMIHEVGKYKDTKKYLPQVKEELLKIRHLIDEMLPAIQIDQMDTDFVEIKLAPMIHHVLAQFNPEIERKHLNICIGTISRVVISDQKILFRILETLVSNAVKYTPQMGNISINDIPEGLEIVNSGITIQEALLPHIFEPFIRDKASTEKGHGLGLYLVDNYIHLLNGEIQISNGENKVIVSLYFKEENILC